MPTRFSKKSSLVRHFQNVHDIAKTDNTDEVYNETQSQEKMFSDLHSTIISVPDSTMSEGARDTDLSDMNKQFDVEVSYCEDIDDILNVPNDTLFIMDTAIDSRESNMVVESISREADTENLEEIEKFLEESKAEPVPETSKATAISAGPKEVRISKDHSYRIPKSPKKPAARLKAYEQQTPHIPYQKEASLTVISVGKNSLIPKVTNPMKAPLTSPKKISFEEALNVALAPSSKRERIKPAHKGIKVIRAEPFALPSHCKQKNSTPPSTFTSATSSSPSMPPKIPDEEKVLKRDSEDRKPVCSESAANVGLLKTAPSMPGGSGLLKTAPSNSMPGGSGRGSQQCGVVEPRQAEPFKRKIESSRLLEKNIGRSSGHQHEKKSRLHKERHSHVLEEPSRRPMDKTGPHHGSSSSERISSSNQHLSLSELGSSRPRMTELKSSQDKLSLDLSPSTSSMPRSIDKSPCTNSMLRSIDKTDSSSFVDALSSTDKVLESASHNSCSSSTALSDQKQQSRTISSPPLSPEAKLALRLELSPKLQATLTSALSNIALSTASATGYYTSRAAASGLTNIESEEENSSSKDEKQGLTLLPTNFPKNEQGLTHLPTNFDDKQGLTLLPSNFPTFDSTASLISSLTSLQSLPSKPTAVVSPSR